MRLEPESISWILENVIKGITVILQGYCIDIGDYCLGLRYQRTQACEHLVISKRGTIFTIDCAIIFQCRAINVFE